MLISVDAEVELEIHFPVQEGKPGLGHGNFKPNPPNTSGVSLLLRLLKILVMRNALHMHTL